MSVTRILSRSKDQKIKRSKDQKIKRSILLWGYQQNSSVDNATLNRFFSLHYLLPFILAGLVVLHLIALSRAI